jgi:hypothetical protein
MTKPSIENVTKKRAGGQLPRKLARGRRLLHLLGLRNLEEVMRI